MTDVGTSRCGGVVVGLPGDAEAATNVGKQRTQFNKRDAVSMGVHLVLGNPGRQPATRRVTRKGWKRLARIGILRHDGMDCGAGMLHESAGLRFVWAR